MNGNIQLKCSNYVAFSHFHGEAVNNIGYCIKDASEGYFGKEPEDLTDYESTLLAGVPNAPSKYSPTVNLELAEKRQEQVIERLVACGLFTKERALETLAGSEM